MSNIFKIWGTRRRILLTNQTEIDLLNLKKDHFCSTHSHDKKINVFTIVYGKVRIEAEFGNIVLCTHDSFTVEPSLTHRFYAMEDSVMVECAYVKKGKIDPDDINRISLGGKVVDRKECTIDDLKKMGLLNL